MATADRSWIKPGVVAWVWGLRPPEEIRILERDGNDCWTYEYGQYETVVGCAHESYICATELEAQSEWLKSEMQDLNILVGRIARTRRRVRELEAKGEEEQSG